MPADPKILARIDAHIDENLERTIAELTRLCRQPSVSAQGLGIAECADLVAGLLREHGGTAAVLPSDGHPVVLGEMAGGGGKTLLVYNHYDVQPPEPLALWTSPPFEVARRDGKLFARGVADNKGEIAGRLAAIDAVRAALGSLPCRVKFIVEGEEEIMSPSLPAFLERHKDRLAADACVWEFGQVSEGGAPIQHLGMRGICYVELEVETMARDVHSGHGGSIFPHAAWRLVWALNAIKGPDGRVRVPGFYDDVVAPTARDMAMLAALPDTAEEHRHNYGVPEFFPSLEGVELRRESVFVPTCTICGLTAGYQGPGIKTVQPARASAKVDFRLVPRQDPADIAAKLRRFLDAQGFADVKTSQIGGESPARTDPDDPFVGLVLDAARDVYGKEPEVWPMVGGTGPNHIFIHGLGVPVATLGSGYPGSRAHAPDENIRVEDFRRAMKHFARVVVGMA
jgi:acetylornithine deacetylase/succinyl-diaminopimelate desuccinylase-like protein